VVITEEVVKTAAGNEESGGELMTVLIEHRGVDVDITEDSKGSEGHFKIFPSKGRSSSSITQQRMTEGVQPDLKNLRHVSTSCMA